MGGTVIRKQLFDNQKSMHRCDGLIYGSKTRGGKPCSCKRKKGKIFRCSATSFDARAPRAALTDEEKEGNGSALEEYRGLKNEGGERDISSQSMESGEAETYIKFLSKSLCAKCGSPLTW